MNANWIMAGAVLAAAPLFGQVESKVKPEVKKVEAKAVFAATDTDGDKVVTLAEVKQQRSDMRDALRLAGDAGDPAKAREEACTAYRGKISLEKFLRYDVDDDGKLTPAEFANSEKGAAPDITDADRKLFASITFDEWSAYAGGSGDEFTLSSFRDSMAVHRAAIRADTQKNPAKMYALNRSNSVLRDYHNLLIVDANRNGKITRSESTDFWKKRFNGEDLVLDSANKVLYADVLYLERMSSLDSNEDGALTRDEVAYAYDAPSDAEWKKLDKDGDDSLSKDEVREWAVPEEDVLNGLDKQDSIEKTK